MKKFSSFVLAVISGVVLVGCSTNSVNQENYNVEPDEINKVKIESSESKYTFEQIEQKDYPIIYSALAGDINDVIAWSNTDFGASFVDMVTVDSVMDKMVQPDSYRLIYNDNVLDCHLYLDDEDYVYEISQDMSIRCRCVESWVLSRDLFSNDNIFGVVDAYIKKHNLNIENPSVSTDDSNNIVVVLNDYEDYVVLDDYDIVSVCLSDICSNNKLEYNIMKE